MTLGFTFCCHNVAFFGGGHGVRTLARILHFQLCPPRQMVWRGETEKEQGAKR